MIFNIFLISLTLANKTRAYCDSGTRDSRSNPSAYNIFPVHLDGGHFNIFLDINPVCTLKKDRKKEPQVEIIA